MKQRYLKKMGSFLLASAMVLTMFPTFSATVHAEENKLPTKEQFATAEQLKSFNTNLDDEDGKHDRAKIYFGSNNQEWWIVGSQQEQALTLIAATPLTEPQQFEVNYSQNKTDSSLWADCTYPEGTTVTEVYPNHYGASSIRTILQNLETSYFTNAEQALMNETTILTNDTKLQDDGKSLQESIYSTTDKLYLAHGNDNKNYVTVGSSDSLDGGLLVDKFFFYRDRYGTGNEYVWLRTPAKYPSDVKIIVNVLPVNSTYIYSTNQLVPAFELNLSSVIFASAAPAATSTGNLKLQDTQDVVANGAFTLRHKADNLGSATVSYDRSRVTLTDVPNGTYLVVQNSTEAKAKKITDETEVSASTMGLENFRNCKVWLETTDTVNRMAYATLADEEQGYDVNVTVSEGLTVTKGVQGVAQGSKIDDITVEVTDGYYLPETYISDLQGQLSGLTVRETDTGFTISGTPTSDVNITLPQATKKVYNMALSGSGTFTTTCVGYEPITAKEFTITNTGNVDLGNVNVSVTGKDADKFELSWDNTTLIQPNGTMKVTVKPANDLAVNTYQATLSVSADNVNAVTTDLQFTVSEHDYNAVVTLPTCTEKGYTTYTCKNCSHSYVGDEVNAKGHTFGEWEITDSPTCEQSGSRKHTCTVCGFSETENLNPNGHTWEDDYTVDKEPTCVEDGSKSIHCKNCGAVKDSTTIAKLGHSFTNYVSDNNATCTKDGTKTAKCDRCDETDTLVDVGTMLEHEYEWVYNNDATCEKNGTETGTCKHCHTTVTREKADTALGHEFKNYVSDDNATCTENGTETAKCERCDETDTRVQENSALGHKLGEWKVVKKPTTAETGIKERYCERCDYKETESIPLITDEKPATPTNPDKPDTDNKPNNDKGSPETGDQTSVGLFTVLLSMSALGIAVLTVLKKALKHK